jgi:thiamine-phosphate pyrophosphorylase
LKEIAMKTDAFAPLTGPIGFYPVVPDAAWVRRLLGWGVRTDPAAHQGGGLRRGRDRVGSSHREWRPGVTCRARRCLSTTTGNWRWRHGAYGVHLGQEDLDTADIAALRDAGLRLGLSTHTPAELARAKAVKPSYLAIGPIYPTTLKVMPYEPVGLERLKAWAQDAAPYPVVAIGGISLALMPGVMACGVDGVAVVSAVTLAADPQEAALHGLRLAKR